MEKRMAIITAVVVGVVVIAAILGGVFRETLFTTAGLGTLQGDVEKEMTAVQQEVCKKVEGVLKMKDGAAICYKAEGKIAVEFMKEYNEACEQSEGSLVQFGTKEEPGLMCATTTAIEIAKEACKQQNGEWGAESSGSAFKCVLSETDTEPKGETAEAVKACSANEGTYLVSEKVCLCKTANQVKGLVPKNGETKKVIDGTDIVGYDGTLQKRGDEYACIQECGGMTVATAIEEGKVKCEEAVKEGGITCATGEVEYQETCIDNPCEEGKEFDGYKDEDKKEPICKIETTNATTTPDPADEDKDEDKKDEDKKVGITTPETVTPDKPAADTKKEETKTADADKKTVDKADDKKETEKKATASPAKTATKLAAAATKTPSATVSPSVSATTKTLAKTGMTGGIVMTMIAALLIVAGIVFTRMGAKA